MSLDLLLFLPLALAVVAVWLWWSSRRRRIRLHMPSGQMVYRDTAEHPGEILYDHAHQLKGKPDFLLEQGTLLIPVEAKTGRTPARPYDGHVMQLMAYCVLVEAHTSLRPPYGIIRYPERQFTVEFTPALARRTPDAHRSHTNPRLCAACGFKAQCDERLPEQTGLST